VKVVITGGAGFIGANLCRMLCGMREVTEVVVVDDLSTGSLANLDGLAVTLIKESILDRSALDAACAGADSLVHLAAVPSVARSVEDPLASHAANATGTLEVLEAARRHGVGHLVVASSSSIYGANPVLPKHEGLCAEPMSPYAVSKLATEAYALAYRECFGLSVLALRFFNVFGPLQPAGHAYAAVVPVFIDAALSDRPIPVNGDGTQSRDFTFIGTVTSVITDAILRQVCASGPVNLAFGTRTTVLGLVDELERILGWPLRRVHQPPRAGDVPHSQADSSRLSSLFPRLEPVPFSEGLRSTVDWFRSITPASPTTPVFEGPGR
jgi:UDP-glucose 4-epimerase